MRFSSLRAWYAEDAGVHSSLSVTECGGGVGFRSGSCRRAGRHAQHLLAGLSFALKLGGLRDAREATPAAGRNPAAEDLRELQ
jgi:hypothetical protein